MSYTTFAFGCFIGTAFGVILMALVFAEPKTAGKEANNVNNIKTR